MNSIEILKLLPDDLEWVVFFRLLEIRKIADDNTIKQMYFLQPDLKISKYSFVILSSSGTYLIDKNKFELINAHSHEIVNCKNVSKNIFEKHHELVSCVESDDPDCIGLGKMKSFPPVLLELKIREGVAYAQAIFDKKPDFKNYELLKSVGITFQCGVQSKNKYIARFENVLPSHIHAGILARFTRTAHCNQFFFNHGNIDEHLETGLINSLKNKINSERKKVYGAVINLAEKSLEKKLTLICIPPKPLEPYQYGDIILNGFLLRALNPFNLRENMFDNLDLRGKIVVYLKSKIQNGLWSYHTNGLITSTDSALVLLGFYNKDSVEKLEIFAKGNGEYYPQLFSNEYKKNFMIKDESNAHWCQTDIATTYLIRALRKECDLDEKTCPDFLRKTFAQRSGLYFANPYMTDWFLAMAIKNENDAVDIRKKLIEEILSSMNKDFSFGNFDVALSTSLAILALSELGFTDRILSLSQLKLLDFIEHDGTFPGSTPFYSTLKIDRKRITSHKLTRLILKDNEKQIINIDDEYYVITFYKDEHKIILTSLGLLALAINTNPVKNDIYLLNHKENINELYENKTHSEYIKKVLEIYLYRNKQK